METTPDVELEKLEELHTHGFITDEQYNERRRAILETNEVKPTTHTQQNNDRLAEKPQILLVPPQRNQKLVFTSSLLVMPPPELWPPIVDIKKNHMNPKIKRPPFPHITLLQPFLEYKNFPQGAQLLEQALSSFQPFTLDFSEFKLFKNGASTTLYLDPVVAPADALDKLYEAVARIYPEVAEMSRSGSSFEPHIGVGYFRDVREAERLQRKYQQGWKPMKFTVKEILLTVYDILSRVREDPFEVREVIPLAGNKSNVPHFQPKPEY